MQIFTSLEEVIEATTRFIRETREVDIKRTSPEEILNLFISANRFGREAIAACYRKIFGNDYDTSVRYDYVAKLVYRNYGGLHYSNNSILLSWGRFVSPYKRFIELIAHEIAHDVGHKHNHDEVFWHEYYLNCQKLGLISLEIPYEEGMIEDKYGVRKYGYGGIKGIGKHGNNVSRITYERRCKAMFKHKVFFLEKYSNVYAIKQVYYKTALDICALYHVNLANCLIDRYLATKTSRSIEETWLREPSQRILVPDLIKPITRSILSTYN